MKCKLKIFDSSGVIVNTIHHDIPIAFDVKHAIKTPSKQPLRNMLEIGPHKYWVFGDGKIDKIDNLESLSFHDYHIRRVEHIKEIWADKIKEIEKGLL
jgi:hypothetical protein